MIKRILRQAFWPPITDGREAKRVARRGAVFALVMAVLCILLTTRFGGRQLLRVSWSVALGDAAIFLALAIGIFAMSRTAATIAVIFWLMAILWAIQHRRPAVVVLGACGVVLLFINVVRATNRYHNSLAEVGHNAP